jgi:TPR repeat protein
MYYNKACSLGFKESCNKNLNNNSSDSNISYEESCRRGNSTDCFNVGFYYENGSNGYERNYTKASTYYYAACNLKNSEGCHALGMLFVQGMGVNEDFSTARFYLKKACDLGKSESCILYGELQSSGY